MKTGLCFSQADFLFQNNQLSDFFEDFARFPADPLIGQTQSAVSDAYKTAQQVQNGQQVLVIAGLVVAGVVAVQALK